MNKPSIGPNPYSQLGAKLRNLRKSSNESLSDVSGAVEIDEHILERYEAGMDRPDEEVLYLLINHYGLNDRLAAQLWDLAGYGDVPNDGEDIQEALVAAKQLIMVLATDTRTMYTDGLHVEANKNGLQITFTQSLSNGKNLPVSRVGMSYEQATDMIQAVGVALTYIRYGQKQQLLPPGNRK
jgi:transcriptional regulator with XRE-family HTH domain